MNLEGIRFITGETEQGIIKEELVHPYYMVSFFSWANGETTHDEIVSMFNMVGWRLFHDSDLFHKAASKITT